MIEIYYQEDGTAVIKEDNLLKEKLPDDLDISKIDISNEAIDAHNLAFLADKASCAGVYYVERYIAVKAAFERQQALVTEQAKQPRVSHAPAITSRTIKPVDA
ncbi:hypothetical protein [Lysinibacillus fusiformis]|uniref:hypothetical protein n=1 Tax=Lysinibacillus fusiformis TaxID=28031 RepID=UPI0037157CBD